MIPEQRRRAYLDAMQVTTWLPRTELPFAAASRLELLEPLQEEAFEPVPESVAVTPAPVREAPVERPKIEIPRPGIQPRQTAVEPVAEVEPVEEKPARVSAPPPRFALQLLRAGDCALLVELPTGQPFQSRDPAYILLKDLLRAARLPDKPQQVGDGEPIRWPLLHRGSLDQSGDAARDYVQGVLAGELEQMGCACLWLIGLPALRFAGEVEAEACYRELNIEGIGPALAMPGLEHLMEQPGSKARLWQAMRRSMPRWVVGLNTDMNDR